MKAWKIKNWDSIYETNDTRKRVNLHWVPVPNKHDGLVYSRIAEQPNAAEIFTGFQLMVQIASKSEKSMRGILIRDNLPLSADDMALISRFPADVFKAAFEFLDGLWIERILLKNEQSAAPSADHADMSADHAANLPLNRIEQNRTEEERECAREANPDSEGIPTVDEMIAAGDMQNIPPQICRDCWEHYQGGNLWLNQHGRLINWRQKLTTWARKEEQRASGRNGTPTANKPESAWSIKQRLEAINGEIESAKSRDDFFDYKGGIRLDTDPMNEKGRAHMTALYQKRKHLREQLAGVNP